MISLLDICIAFNKYQIDYLIIGGDAVAFYGVERVSLDYDIWIRNDENTYKNTIKALYKIGYLENTNKISVGNKNYERWEILKLYKLNRFEIADEKPLDILSHDIKYKKFDNCYKRKKTVVYNDIQLYFISLRDLRALKKQANRDKDLFDLKHLKGVK